MELPTGGTGGRVVNEDCRVTECFRCLHPGRNRLAGVWTGDNGRAHRTHGFLCSGLHGRAPLGPRLEVEQLACHVLLGVHAGHERAYLAAGDLLDRADEVVSPDVLEVDAKIT